MKLLMVIVDDDKKEELEVVLRRSGVTGYTELRHASGVGTTGPRLGSAAFPKTSAVIFTFVEDDAAPRLAQELRSYCSECGERVRMVTWGVEEVV